MVTVDINGDGCCRSIVGSAHRYKSELTLRPSPSRPCRHHKVTPTRPPSPSPAPPDYLMSHATHIIAYAFVHWCRCSCLYVVVNTYFIQRPNCVVSSAPASAKNERFRLLYVSIFARYVFSFAATVFLWPNVFVVIVIIIRITIITAMIGDVLQRHQPMLASHTSEITRLLSKTIRIRESNQFSLSYWSLFY